MASFPASAARIAARLLLVWVLLVVAGVATAASHAATAGELATSPSMRVSALVEAGHAYRDDASCSKAPSIQQIREFDIAKAEAEPELSLDGARLQRCALAVRVPESLRDATCVARRNRPLGRGPPRLV